MFKCDVCDKEFETYRGLNGHKRVHGKSTGGYSSSRVRIIRPTFACLYCGISGTYNPDRSNGKYCSNKCQRSLQWIIDTKPSIEAGDISSKPALKRYLKEVNGDSCSICSCPPIWNDLPLVLQVDHVDGNNANNKASNLRLVCPNCHTQTETFTYKKRPPSLKQNKRNKK